MVENQINKLQLQSFDRVVAIGGGHGLGRVLSSLSYLGSKLSGIVATCEACDAIDNADLIILGPGSFLTSIMPPLLLPKIAKAIEESNAKIIFIDNINKEASSAGQFSLKDKIQWCEQVLGGKEIDKVICHQSDDKDDELNKFSYFDLESRFNPGMHDKTALVEAIDAVSKPHLINSIE